MKKFSFPLIVLLSITAMSSCRNKQAEVNPLLAPWDTPYEVPPFDKIEIRHYKPAVEQAIVRHQKEIDSIASNPAAPDFENTIAALDRSGETLDRVYTTFSLVAAADNNEAMQQADLEISPAVAAHRDDIYLNEKLFERVEAVYEKLDSLPLTPEQKRLTELTYKNFVRAGAGLTPRSKKRLREINSELTTLGIRFGNNLLAENKDFALVLDSLKQTTGLPDDVINAAAAEAEARGMKGKYVFTLGKPSLIPFLTYAKDRNLRERLYRGYLNRGANGGDHDNTRIVERIVRLLRNRILRAPAARRAPLKSVPQSSYQPFTNATECAATTPAVSVRRRLRPSETARKPLSSAERISSEEKSPSGPIRISTCSRGPKASPSGVRFPLSSQWAISRLPAQGSSSSSRKGIGESTRGR